jgi:fatty acid synthase subunit alpha
VIKQVEQFLHQVVKKNHSLPLLDVAYHSRQLAFRRKQISRWLDHEHTKVRAEVESLKQHEDYFASRVSGIEKEVKCQETDGLAMYACWKSLIPR